jgi:hypothetical protein
LAESVITSCRECFNAFKSSEVFSLRVSTDSFKSFTYNDLMKINFRLNSRSNIRKIYESFGMG